MYGTEHKLTVKDVPAHDFIKAFAEHLKKTEKIAIPDWYDWAKTSCKHELAPYDPDWIFIRAGKLLGVFY